MKTLSRLMLAGSLVGFAIAAQAQTPPAGAAGQTTPSTTEGKMEPKAGQKHDPGSVGAMDKAVGGVATSAQDVGAQQQGKPTAAEAGKMGTSNSGTAAGKPMDHSPGTVGAAPGANATPPSERSK